MVGVLGDVQIFCISLIVKLIKIKMQTLLLISNLHIYKNSSLCAK